MKVFKELKKLGYKHYTEHTIEELDNLPLNSEERIMEQALVLKWFREKYGYLSYIDMDNYSFYRYTIYKGKGISKAPFETYEEAELACMRKLIEIVKQES